MGCVEGQCGRPTIARGFCTMHYQRWRKAHGTPRPATAEERFWSRVDKRGPDDCWRWKGKPDKKGYGHFSVDQHPCSAHRYAYELANGPIPEGMTVDHDCHSRSTCAGGVSCPHRLCVNPAHLIVVTRRTNVLLGRTIPAANLLKTHCDRGHLFDEANTRIDPRTGHRCCRACGRENVAAYRARQLALV